MSRSKHRPSGTGFSREVGIPDDENFVNVLASSRLKPVPQGKRTFRKLRIVGETSGLLLQEFRLANKLAPTGPVFAARQRDIRDIGRSPD